MLCAAMFFKKEVTNMSWIKNKFNKLFKMDPNDEYDAYDEYTETPEIERPQQQVQPNIYEEVEPPKKAFRFPLIEDEFEQEQSVNSQVLQQQLKTTRFYDEDNEKLTLPNYLQKAQTQEVYDVEVSGIRDLLERRRKGKGQSSVIQSNENLRRLPITKEERVAFRNKPVSEVKSSAQSIVKPVENRKRFVPTDVPSPVHGFRKPTPIEQLIEKQHGLNENIGKDDHPEQQIEEVQLQETVNIVVEPQIEQTVENDQTVAVEQMDVEKQLIPLEVQEPTPSVMKADEIEVLPVMEEEVVEVDEVQEHLEQQPAVSMQEEAKDIDEKPDTSIADTLNDVQVKHVTIENSTIHIGHLNVEQIPPTNEDVVIEQTEQVTQSIPQMKTGSRVPFNVVMLKSDKQKLQTKKFVKQQLEKQNDNVSIDEKQERQYFEKKNESVIQNPLSEQKDSSEVDAIISLPPTAVGLLDHEPVVETNANVIERIEEQFEVVAPVEMPGQDLKALPVDEKREIPSEEEFKLEVAATSEQQVEKVEQAEEAPQAKKVPYVKPPLEYLVPPEEMVEDREWMDEQGENLVEALSHFQIQAHIESIVQGPAVTQFEITVGQGTKVSKVRNLTDDIKLALAAKDIRIDAPIPGKRSIGIEIPNRISRSVRLSEVTDSESFTKSDSPLEAALGLDLAGKPVTIDLRKMPHGLIAGATGSGKSVCINSILVSLLYKSDPNDLKLMLIDPKMVELAPFNHIPHLVSPVITDVKAATAALKWAVEEMERRYQLFMHSGARKIESYNKMCEENGMYAQKLPYLLIVIDELADLMMMSPQDVEDSIVRITQKARAAGIHLIVATQRPSVDVITGLIKSNIPTRIAFSVSSQIDSRTILDTQGAERLLGRGDMLYLGNGMSAPTRIQGTFVTDDEIEEIIEYVREQGEPQYIFKQEELLKRSEAVEEQDELFEEVCRFVFEQGSASTSLLQRRYHIGYNRAARLIDMLERQGYVSEPKGSKPRDVFITEEDLAEQFGD